MANLIAIAFSDIHFYKWRAFNKDDSRLDWSIKALETISTAAKVMGVPLLFGGDWFHQPAGVENETYGKVVKAYQKYIEQRKIDCYAISGNHDFCQKNGLTYKSPSHLDVFYEVFNTFSLLDNHDKPFSLDRGMNSLVWGIPYMNSDKEIKKRVKQLKPIARKYRGFKILLMHGDCPGAVNDEGMQVGELESIPKNLDKFFEEWDLVLFGHIHVPQKLSKKCYMLGSPIHQTSGNKVEMGYWKIFSDQSPKFVGLANFPKFVKLKKGEIAQPDGSNHYYIPYEEIGAIEEVEKGEFDLSLGRSKLAKRYLKLKGIKDPEKRLALINALNAEE